MSDEVGYVVVPGRKKRAPNKQSTSRIEPSVIDMAMAIASYLAPQYKVNRDDAIAGAVKFLFESLTEQGKIQNVKK